MIGITSAKAAYSTAYEAWISALCRYRSTCEMSDALMCASEECDADLARLDTAVEAYRLAEERLDAAVPDAARNLEWRRRVSRGRGV